MADPKAKCLRYFWTAVLCVPFACGGSDSNHPGDSRVLDTACAKTTTSSDPKAIPTDGCQLVGSAKKTSGLTADSTGLVIGPHEGTLTIVVPELPLPGDDDTWTFEILARGHGRFDVPSCNTPPPSGTDGGSGDEDAGYTPSSCIDSGTPKDSFDWIGVGAEGYNRNNTFRRTQKTPITLHVAEGSSLEIVDVRIVSKVAPTGCGG